MTFALLTLSGCVTDLDLTHTEQALTPAVVPINNTFEIRADRVVYIGNEGGSYRAYELDEDLVQIRKSAPIASVSKVENLTTDGTRVLFGDGSRNVQLPLDGGAPQTFDAIGVFGKGLRGNGGVTLRDGTLTRLITANGFGVSAWSPVEVFSGGQPSGVPVLSMDMRGYVAPASNYLRLVNVDTKSSKLICKSSTPYAVTKSMATAHDLPKGTVKVIAKLSDGRLSTCTNSATGQTMKTIHLPFTIADVTFEGGGGLGFEGGGGLGFEGGGGLGIWAASATTAQLAYIAPSGKVTIIPLTNKVGITPIPIPRVVRSFSDGSALVFTSTGKFLRVPRP